MKIVIDARQYSTSTGRYVRKLLEYLEKIDGGSRRDYLVLLKSEDIEKYLPAAKNFSKLVADFAEFSWAEQLAFNKFLKSLEPDLVHFLMVQQPVLYRQPKITTMHDLTTLRYKNPAKNWLILAIKQMVYKWLNKKVARDSLYIITPSNFVAKDVAALTKVEPKKIITTYESADKITAQARPIKALIDKQFLFYIGNSTPHKNLERLVEAFGLLNQTQPDLWLILGGKINYGYNKLQKFIDKKAIRNIKLIGYVSEPQLKWLYENCQAYVFPSLSEGFGLPGLEAFVHGAPLISSNKTCLPEIYGSSAVYFDPENVNDIADKISQVISRKNLQAELAKKGYDQAKKYSWSKMAEQTLDIYKKVLEELN